MAHSHLDASQELEQFRAAKDEFMLGPDSPLTDDQKTTFEHLSYYPPNDALRVEASLDPDVSSEPLVMQTTTGEEQEYVRLGKVHFEVDGQSVALTVFGGGDQMFLPMRDATSTEDTSPAGRYVEPEPAGDGKVLLDFNYLYNPYCAYNPRWSCPIPPVENWLQVPIRAGEKRFHD
ncbi:MAG: DUF1684 domain-containing protein [Acidobacteriaceae bacterium]